IRDRNVTGVQTCALPISLILIVLALLLAGGTAWLASSYLNSQRQTIVREAEPLKVATPSKSVLVAKADLKRGQILRPEDTTWQEIGRASCRERESGRGGW